MARPSTFAERIAAGFALCLVVGMSIAALAVFALRSVAQSRSARTHALAMDLLEVERLRLAFSEEVSSQRGYVLFADPVFRAQADLASSRVQSAVERLRARLAEPSQRRLLERVEASVRAYQAAVSQVRQLRADGRPGNGRDLDARAAPARTEALDAMGALLSATEQALETSVRENARAEWRAFAFILAGSLLGLVLAAGLGFVLTGTLSRVHATARDSECRFRLLVEGVTDYAIYLLDPSGRVASWNPGAERINGWTEEEIHGKPDAVFYTPEEVAADRPRKVREQAVREGRVRREMLAQCKNGRAFWADVLITAIRDEQGMLQGFAVVSRDITERKRVEQAQHLFAEASQVLNRSLDSADIIRSLGKLLVPGVAEGCILFYPTGSKGPLVVQLASHQDPAQEVLLEQLARRCPPEAEGGLDLSSVLETGRSKYVPAVTPALLERRAKDPEQRALLSHLDVRSCMAVPLISAGETRGVLVLLSSNGKPYRELDVSFLEELAARTALALHNASLFHETQQALELIAVAAHDLGTPLQALQLQLARLRRLASSQREQLEAGLATAEHQARRLGQLLHDLLDFSRLSSGGFSLALERMDLAELARDTQRRMAEAARAAGCELSLDAPEHLPGHWDGLRLERVLTNLVSNALKFGRGRPVELTVRRQDGRAQLVVRDHGGGIAEEDQGRIFGRFERAEKADKQPGFGLGLFIVRKLIEAHGGSIWVESRLGEGAAFIVELPLGPEQTVSSRSTYPVEVHREPC